MELILTENCKALSGSLGSGFGYFFVKRKNRFYAVRSKHSVPPDGHLRFIFACAEMASNHLYFTDIRVSREEMDKARKEAGIKPIAYCFPCKFLDAKLVLYIKNHYPYERRKQNPSR